MANVPIPYEALSGAQKAAILVLAIGEERAGKLLGRLDLDEVKQISTTASALGRVDASTVERVLEEFLERLRDTVEISGSLDAVQKLLTRALDKDRAAAILEEIRGPSGRTVWEKLGGVDEASLAAYLRNEYPQTIAVVLSRLEPAKVARVLAAFPDELASDVILRMLRLEAVQPDVLADVERMLRSEFISNLSQTDRRDNHEIMAEIFNNFDRATETRLMASLEERDREAAERIKKLMFTFEDLARLDGAGIQALVRNAGNDRLIVALKGASEQMRELFFRNMSERAAKILKEEMQTMGPVRLRDVEEAQQFLVNMAKELAAAGEIYLGDGKDEQMVY
ncbi:MAG: flagellar motor switch protein FliG [Geminicoccaceae bacterium]|nr:flagellar motor switch protein FliG [Geminicoccaceae bacterium]